MASLRKSLEKKLTKKQLELVPSSFDVIGSIAIFSDFPEELISQERLIGETLIKLNRNIETVAKKTKKISGKYRTRKIKIIAGKRKKETSYRENGIEILLNVENCYFSPRLSTERLRIASLVKKNEKVLVEFSGTGIYSLVISRNSRAKEIFGIEINPSAHKYAMKNKKKFPNITFFLGNVKKIIPKLKIKFDRIVMPLPPHSLDYLKDTLEVSKKGTVIHLYCFDLKETLRKIKKEKLKVIRKIKTGQVSPGKYRYCIDLRVI